MPDRMCSIDGCDRNFYARGWCSMHYKRWRRNGTTDDLRPTVEQRFWSKVDKNGPTSPFVGTQCWVWTDYCNDNGYGNFSIGQQNLFAHRISYEIIIGAIPADNYLDHRCHLQCCVRPDHLRPVTPKQNQENRRGAPRNSTSGIRGVIWSKKAGKWRGEVTNHGRRYFVGHFDNIKDAEDAVIARRNELFTHNDADRIRYT